MDDIHIHTDRRQYIPCASTWTLRTAQSRAVYWHNSSGTARRFLDRRGTPRHESIRSGGAITTVSLNALMTDPGRKLQHQVRVGPIPLPNELGIPKTMTSFLLSTVGHTRLRDLPHRCTNQPFGKDGKSRCVSKTHHRQRNLSLHLFHVLRCINCTHHAFVLTVQNLCA